jgi:hypothetical protein
MAGATWRDPDRLEEWIDELSPEEPVAVYCSYGFDVGCNVTRALRERGFDARYVRGDRVAGPAREGARAGGWSLRHVAGARPLVRRPTRGRPRCTVAKALASLAHLLERAAM